VEKLGRLSEVESVGNRARSIGCRANIVEVVLIVEVFRLWGFRVGVWLLLSGCQDVSLRCVKEEYSNELRRIIECYTNSKYVSSLICSGFVLERSKIGSNLIQGYFLYMMKQIHNYDL
jgi:hypothetical protein